MPLYRYVKSVVVYKEPSIQISFKAKQLFWKVLPNVFIVVGAAALTTVAYPLINYQLLSYRWQQNSLISPVSEVYVAEAKGIVNPLGAVDAMPPVLAAQTKNPEIVNGVDFTKADNWFPKASFKNTRPSKITHYRISIPALKIDQMLVEVGGNDLNKSLIHYAGTAMPGEYGNPVIFGHSILPVFYNPKNYISIFSLLPTLKKGSEIYIDFDGVQYKYVVDSYIEVDPENVEVLEQRFDRQSLTLITCVPPGTYLRRGIIQAYLAKL